MVGIANKSSPAKSARSAAKRSGGASASPTVMKGKQIAHSSATTGAHTKMESRQPVMSDTGSHPDRNHIH